jgi:predicted MFS family arabinose efflux permease
MLIANVTSDIGAFMQTVGAAWLMVSLHGGPMFVALTQTAAALPFFLLALPAGAVGDIVDRRKVLLFTQIWMAFAALVLALVTLSGRMSPMLLLILTFALSAGDAFESPTWRAVLPELVAKEDLAAASALNGIEFNLARAVGPALGGLLIALAGVGVAFVVNALSFIGVIVALARWKRIAVKKETPPETVSGATAAAIRYVRYSPAVLVVMLRAGTAMFFASGLLALLPSIAHRAYNSPIAYGALLGAFGVGAVFGAVGMQRARGRWSTDVIVSVGIAVLGITMIATGATQNVWWLGGVMLVGGASWTSFLSLFNVQILNRAPDWVRARVLAVTMLVFQGAVAGGSALWGALAIRVGLSDALLIAGAGTLLSASLGYFFRLSESAVDLTPWNNWRMPTVVNVEGRNGPVLITVEYELNPGLTAEFIAAMREYGRRRRRDGAMRWHLSRDLEVQERYLETFVVSSWEEHLRQHHRGTRADSQIEEQLKKYTRTTPVVRHLLDL